jgi:hypothetical protein
MIKTWSLFVILLLLSCEGGFRTKTIENELYGISMNVPWYWQSDNALNPEAIMGAASSNSNSAIMVLLATKQEGDFLSEKAFAERDRVMGWFTRSTFLGSQTLTLAEYPALQFQVKASLGELDIRYIHTILETDQYFPQIIAWTEAERFEDNKEELFESIESIKVKEN